MTSTEPAPVLLLGEPGLRVVSKPVVDPATPAFEADRQRLHATLEAFRREHGFGRAISAPQIGVHTRLIALSDGKRVLSMVNPEITRFSDETVTLWDDCMSFPDLLVRVRRPRSISLRFHDHEGNEHEWTRLDPATSELLLHEIDHLDGVLAVDHAIDRQSLVVRKVFDADRSRFFGMVDHVTGGPWTMPG